MRLSLSTEVQQNTHTAPGTGARVDGCAGVCEIRNAGKDLTTPPSRGGNQDRTPQRHPLSGITGCNALKTGAKCGRMLQHSTPPRIDTDIVLQTGVAAACERNPIPRLCEMHT